MRRLSKFVAVVLSIIIAITCTACDVELTPEVNFGFKTNDGPGEFNESITSVEIGKRFYTCINIKLRTDKKSAEDYTVVVEVPKTKEVEVKGMGGLEPNSIDWDEQKGLSRLTFTMQGYKEATNEKILFYGTPTEEGEAKMTVHIYDIDNNEVNAGYSRTIFFVYELQGENNE